MATTTNIMSFVWYYYEIHIYRVIDDNITNERTSVSLLTNWKAKDKRREKRIVGRYRWSGLIDYLGFQFSIIDN